MLSIGEFSHICKVSTKTLRYYAEIGLILPEEINPENGYRYYSIAQLEKMLFINRLKAYNFSLEEIKAILSSEGSRPESLYPVLARKRDEIEKHAQRLRNTVEQIDNDIARVRQGAPLMSYLEGIDVQFVEIPLMCLLSIRKMVQQHAFADEYRDCFGRLFRHIADDKLTTLAPPLVLFHSAEYCPSGLDTEFAVPVKEYVTGTRDFHPGLCLKTVLHGSYAGLPSVYVKQREWAEREGYELNNALFEVYVTDPSQTENESELITEVYSPVKKKISGNRG